MKEYDFLKNVDKKIRPGDDFFTYVNNNWIKKNPIPGEHSGWAIFHVLHSDIQHNLKDLLDGLVKKAWKDSNLKKLRDFYVSGMNEKRLNREGAKPLVDEFTDIDSIKNKKDLVKMIARLHAIGADVVWGDLVEPDDKDSKNYIFRLLQSGIALPDREYYLSEDDRSKEIRKKYLAFISSLSKLFGRAMDKKTAQVILHIETDLARASMEKTEMRDAHLQYNKMDLKGLRVLSPNIAWDDYFKSIGLRDDKMKTLLVNQPKFIKAVDAMFNNLSLDEWKSYLIWHLMLASAPYLSENIAKERFKFAGKVLSGAKRMRPRWKRVISEIDGMMGEALGKLYVEKFFPKEAKRKMDVMIDDIFSAYHERIKALDWMSPATKKKAADKLSRISRKIGYPKKWEKYSKLEISPNSFIENHWRGHEFAFNKMLRKLGKPVDRSEWHMSPPTVNAYYWANMNEIVFPAGILQPPSFDLTATDAMNYGGIGAVIGHELTHGFDDEGCKFDGHGNLKEWWTKDDKKRFDQKTKKLVIQYSACEVLPGLHCNGKLTLGENIADLGGLTIAYDAFKKRLEKGGYNKTLYGFTPEQQFFIAWAREWAGSLREEQARQYLIVDPHSPYKLRVNMIVNNIDAFYQAFNIGSDAKLYRKPAERIKIW